MAAWPELPLAPPLLGITLPAKRHTGHSSGTGAAQDSPPPRPFAAKRPHTRELLPPTYQANLFQFSHTLWGRRNRGHPPHHPCPRERRIPHHHNVPHGAQAAGPCCRQPPSPSVSPQHQGCAPRQPPRPAPRTAQESAAGPGVPEDRRAHGSRDIAREEAPQPPTPAHPCAAHLPSHSIAGERQAGSPSPAPRAPPAQRSGAASGRST